MESDFCFLDTATQRRIPLVDGMVFGRNSGDEQFPDDRKMSREHFKISIHGIEVFLKDLNSSNTTRVNQVPLPPMQPTPLRIHDVVEFGSQKFVFMFTKKMAEQVAAPVPDQVVAHERVSNRVRLVELLVRLRNRARDQLKCADRFALGVALAGLLVTVAALYTALDGLTVSRAYPGLVLGLEIFVVFGAATVLSAYAVAKGSKRFTKRRVLKPILLMFAIPVFFFCVELGKFLTGYPERLMANTIASLCSSPELNESCMWAATRHPGAYERLPRELKERLSEDAMIQK